MLVYVAIFGSSVVGAYKVLRREGETLDTPVMLLLCAVLCNVLEVLFKLVHLSVYAFNGEGFLVLDVFSLLFSVAA